MGLRTVISTTEGSMENTWKMNTHLYRLFVQRAVVPEI
jgi:hypothetical protein